MDEFSYPLRAFISYAHSDREIVERIIQILSPLGFQPLWDDDISPGRQFPDEIRNLITRAHVMLPVITEDSRHRPWIHQEIGMAIALNIPILPIAIGVTPSEMIASVQAITIEPDLSDLAQSLQDVDWENVILPAPEKPYGLIEVVDLPDERAKRLADYTNWAADIGEYSLIRSKLN